MNRLHFNVIEEKHMKRLRVLQEMLAEIKFEDTPCLRLESQLSKAEVLVSGIEEVIVALKPLITKG